LTSKVRNRPSRSATVGGGQRERLIEGMTQVAARYGYREASVARVVEGAGVSRATFYEHFADKEACFLAAFERAARRIELALPRIEAEYSPAHRAAELLADLLSNMVRDPAAARILLVEALAGGPEVRRAHERFMLGVEATFEEWLAGPGEYGVRLTVPGRAVMEGTCGVLLMRCFRGETAGLTELRDDIVTWIHSYAAPEDQPRLSPAEWRRLGAGLTPEPITGVAAEPVTRLPRGRSAVAPESVIGAQRQRILTAVGQLARMKGYAATTVADIVKAAAVTRESFYDLFRNKEDAFLAAQISVLEQTISLSAAGFFPGETWPARIWGGLRALFSHVSMEPDAVYLDVIESYAAGEAAMRRSFDNRMTYGLFFEDGYRQRPEAENLPRLCSETVGGAIVGLMRWQVGEGRTEQMLEVLPQAAYVVLAPFIGPAAAIAFVEAKAVEEGAPATA
jgi:AcrR family transcriptional regulator